MDSNETFRVLLIDNFGPEVDFGSQNSKKCTDFVKREFIDFSDAKVKSFANGDNFSLLPGLLNELVSPSKPFETKFDDDEGRTHTKKLSFRRIHDFTDHPFVRNHSTYLPTALKGVVALHDAAVVLISPDPRPAWLWGRMWFQFGFWHGRRNSCESTDSYVSPAPDIAIVFQMTELPQDEEKERKNMAWLNLPPNYANVTSDLGLPPIDFAVTAKDVVNVLKKRCISKWKETNYESPSSTSQMNSRIQKVIGSSDSHFPIDYASMGYSNSIYYCDLAFPLIGLFARARSAGDFAKQLHVMTKAIAGVRQNQDFLDKGFAACRDNKDEIGPTMHVLELLSSDLKFLQVSLLDFCKNLNKHPDGCARTIPDFIENILGVSVEDAVSRDLGCGGWVNQAIDYLIKFLDTITISKDFGQAYQRYDLTSLDNILSKFSEREVVPSHLNSPTPSFLLRHVIPYLKLMETPISNLHNRMLSSMHESLKNEFEKFHDNGWIDTINGVGKSVDKIVDSYSENIFEL